MPRNCPKCGIEMKVVDETLYKQEYNPRTGDFEDTWEPMFEGCRDYSYKCPKCGHSES